MKNETIGMYLQATFAMTGNESYVKKIMTFLNKFPPKIRDMYSRGEENLVESLSKEEQSQFQTYLSISDQLGYDIAMKKLVDRAVKKILNANPDLNFHKDFKMWDLLKADYNERKAIEKELYEQMINHPGSI